MDVGVIGFARMNGNMAVRLIQCLRSRTERSFADRQLAALRRSFGGHAVRFPANGPA